MRRCTALLAVLQAMTGTARAAREAEGHYRIGQRTIPEVVIQKDPSRFRVHAEHPRLFFRDTDLPAIRARINGSHREEWRQMLAYIDGKLLKADPKKYAQKPYLKAWYYGRNATFVAAITGEKKYRDWALSWADFMVKTGPEGNDDDYRGRLMSMAVAYDWLYPWLSEAERKGLQGAIVAHIDRNWYFAEKPSFIGGHSRWGNFALAAGLLAVVTELPELRRKLLRVRENWIGGYHPAQGWIATDGGYHMGWTYSAPYTRARNHCVWSSATNECVYYPWRAKLPYLWIYGNRGDGTYPNTGDAYGSRDDLNYARTILTVAAGVLKNRHAAWMIRPSWNRFYDVLYVDKHVTPLAPDDGREPLPVARHFRNAGVVMMRDRWDGETTLLQFKSTSFYSANHHHRDENSFTLDYRGSLAIDSGYYDKYGSTHWRNYFTRTIAHNSIIVFDPEQEMKVYGRPAANDGGQVYRREPLRLEDIRPGGHASLDGMVRYEHRKAFTYAMGDATKAYDPARVKLAQREIFYVRASTRAPVRTAMRRDLRARPLIVIFDRVQSANAGLEKRFLLHTVDKPTVSGDVCVVEHGGGRLSCVTLLPDPAEVRLVGGPGKEFFVDGKNYPPERLPSKGKGIEPGAWRVEVVPKVRRPMDYFLHVLLIRVKGTVPRGLSPLPDRRASVTLVKGDACAGAEVAGRVVVFPLAPEGARSLRYKVGGPGPVQHLVAGLRPGAGARYAVDGRTVGTVEVGEGGCALFRTSGNRGARITVTVGRRPKKAAGGTAETRLEEKARLKEKVRLEEKERLEEKKLEEAKREPRLRAPAVERARDEAEAPREDAGLVRLLKRAERLFIEGKIEEAREIFGRIAERAPGTPSAEKAREYLEILRER